MSEEKGQLGQGAEDRLAKFTPETVTSQAE